RLVRFAPLTTRVYMLEVGPSYIRFFRRRTPILDGGGIPWELPTSYSADQLEALYFEQRGKDLWVFHKAHEPRRVHWDGLSDTGFTLVTPAIDDGPYLDLINSGTALTPTTSGTNTATLNAAGPLGGLAGVNNDQGFQTTDVGRKIRLQQRVVG